MTSSAADSDSSDERDDPPPRRGQTTVDRPADSIGDDSEMRLVLEPTSRAAGLARRAMWDWQSAFDLDEQFMENTVMVVSELVTNAVTHAQSSIEIIATMNADGLRVEVHDLLADPPVTPSDRDTRAYGLRLVAELTDRWGWRPTAAGKYVWTETSCARPADGDVDGSTERPP
ncbi:MAG: ATP-binding protein [Ilumatobacteraceae bacterium]